MSEPLREALFDRDLPHDCRRALFGGQGAVRVWSLAGAPAPPFTAVLACELEPGASVGAHVQQEYPEIVVGISGSGQVAVGAEARAFSAGQVVHLPLGETLAIDNTAGDVPLRYLIIKAFASR
jgi:quercetin dioxygenase-like cupin family protein